MTDALSGVHVAALTPFERDGEQPVDAGAYLAHLGWLVAQGVDGLVCCGTNGEGPSLTAEEQLRLLERVADADLGVPITAAVIETALPAALEVVRACGELGVAAVMVAPPSYFKPLDVAGLRAWYARVLEAASVPVIAYHIPKYAVPVPDDVIGDLPLWGVKDSGGDPAYAEAVLARGRGVLLGTEANLWDGLALGAHGVISALANAAPEGVVALHRAFRAGDHAQGQAIEAGLLELRRRVKAHPGPAVLKRLAEHRHGHPMGTVRAPLTGLPDDADLAPLLDLVGSPAG